MSARTSKNWASRIVRNGRVKICGKWYAPLEHHMIYDGRLEGHRFRFGRYYTAGQLEPFVSLWGIEGSDGMEGPHRVEINGVGHYPWEWWDDIPPDEAGEE